jgi:molybdenum cofactor cytidylyltransferase
VRAAPRDPDDVISQPPDPGDLLADELGADRRELVAFVGAGGKTTLLRALGAALERRGRHVVLTTTTRVGIAEMADRPGFWSVGEADGKLVGPPPEEVDAVFSSGAFDAILVEADGARRMLVKAPAKYEPVIPSSSTLVVAVFPEAALSVPIEHAAHRPELVAAVVGCGTDGRMTPARAARLIGGPAGYRKAVPPDARFLAAILRTTRTPSPVARDLVVRLRTRGIRTRELRVPTPA